MKRRVVELDPREYWETEITVIDPDTVVTAPIPRLDDEPVSHRREPSWWRRNWLNALAVFIVVFFITLDTLTYMLR